MIRSLSTALIAALALAATGCGIETEGSADIGERTVRVTTTTNFITDTVREIGGDRVEVQGLMGPGVDPHLYRASAGDVQTLRDADVIFYAGLDLEGRMADLLDQLAERQPTKAVTDDLPREELLAPPEGAEEQFDPHVWFDVALWQTVSRTIADQLTQIDPEGAEVYEANLARYDGELAAVDDEIRQLMAGIPASRRVLVTSHDAFEYLGRRYDLDVAGIQGISTAAEATTADITRTARLLADRDVPAVFVESSVPRQTIEAVRAAARRLGHEATVGGELFTDAAGDEGTPEGTYVGMVRANARKIAAGLGS